MSFIRSILYTHGFRARRACEECHEGVSATKCLINETWYTIFSVLLLFTSLLNECCNSFVINAKVKNVIFIGTGTLFWCNRENSRAETNFLSKFDTKSLRHLDDSLTSRGKLAQRAGCSLGDPDKTIFRREYNFLLLIWVMG
jgi:hypothetical protein